MNQGEGKSGRLRSAGISSAHDDISHLVEVTYHELEKMKITPVHESIGLQDNSINDRLTSFERNLVRRLYQRLDTQSKGKI